MPLKIGSDGRFSQDESSEEFLGEWMEKRGNRDRMFIATKVTLSPTADSVQTAELSITSVYHQLQDG